MMHFKTRPSEKGDYEMYNVWQFIYLKTSVVLIIIICNNFSHKWRTTLLREIHYNWALQINLCETDDSQSHQAPLLVSGLLLNIPSIIVSPPWIIVCVYSNSSFQQFIMAGNHVTS